MRVLSLDGRWQFRPEGQREWSTIEVPGFWEAQGWLTLDGPAWYERRFEAPAAWFEGGGRPWVLLHFGAADDRAEVWLNGQRLGSHEGAFTPFWFECGAALRAGENVLRVLVTDVVPPELYATPHGKQGWANDVFPSPPSLYMTFGGLWQSVAIEAAAPVIVDDLAVLAESLEAASVEVTLRNLSGDAEEVSLALELPEGIAAVPSEALRLGPGESKTVRRRVDWSRLPLWSPAAPELFALGARLTTADGQTHQRVIRSGRRTFAFDGEMFRLNGEPFYVRGALVQGMYPETLYRPTSPQMIRSEIESARRAGLNVLRLHIKGFHPAYLDLCDEMGMPVHCDLPVAEPIDLEAPELVRRCVQAAHEQVRRDRSRPSVVMWSLMNEICIQRAHLRESEPYCRLVDALWETVQALDPTRPVIENDWLEPDPETVRHSPILTAHLYRRSTRPALELLGAHVDGYAALGRPVLVSEFGEWGLPMPTGQTPPPFWAQDAQCEAWIARSGWSGSPEAFIEGTQRHQGLADRLQIELHRLRPHILGHTVTELTDIPHELNGLVDFLRRPKASIPELARAHADTLPIWVSPKFLLCAGAPLALDLAVSHVGPQATPAATLEVALAGAVLARLRVPPLGHRQVHRCSEVSVLVPPLSDDSALTLRLIDRQGTVLGSNEYPLWIMAAPESTAAPLAADVIAGSGLDASLFGRGSPGRDSPLVVGQDVDWDVPENVARLEAALREGRPVLLLAQRTLPEPLAALGTLRPVVQNWGPTIFTFTGRTAVCLGLPAERVLTVEDFACRPTDLLLPSGDLEEMWVGAAAPEPAELVGAVVGRTVVGVSPVVFCQLRLDGLRTPAEAGVVRQLIRAMAQQLLQVISVKE